MQQLKVEPDEKMQRLEEYSGSSYNDWMGKSSSGGDADQVDSDEDSVMPKIYANVGNLRRKKRQAREDAKRRWIKDARVGVQQDLGREDALRNDP